jgi:hypothetical protein
VRHSFECLRLINTRASDSRDRQIPAVDVLPERPMTDAPQPARGLGHAEERSIVFCHYCLFHLLPLSNTVPIHGLFLEFVAVGGRFIDPIEGAYARLLP